MDGLNMINLMKKPIKQYTSWGEYVTVETIDNTYSDVILCPSVNGKDQHLLEYYNGDVVTVNTIDMISIQREGHDKYVIE